MNKILFILALLLSTSLFSAYQVGDFVRDMTWQDTNLEGATVVTYNHTLSGMIDTDKKVLFLNFFYPG